MSQNIDQFIKVKMSTVLRKHPASNANISHRLEQEFLLQLRSFSYELLIRLTVEKFTFGTRKKVIKRKTFLWDPIL